MQVEPNTVANAEVSLLFAPMPMTVWSHHTQCNAAGLAIHGASPVEDCLGGWRNKCTQKSGAV